MLDDGGGRVTLVILTREQYNMAVEILNKADGDSMALKLVCEAFGWKHEEYNAIAIINAVRSNAGLVVVD